MLRFSGVLFGVIVWGAGGLAETADVRVGVLAYQGSERAAKDWEPTLAHLSRTIPDHRFSMVPLDLPGMVMAVADRRVDFVITNPGNYVTLEARFAVTRIVTLESESVGSPMAALGSTVIRRADRRDIGGDIGDLAELRGRTVAVADGDAFGGFQIAWREMVEAGVRPFKDLRGLKVVGFPMERVVGAVRDGFADAGILRGCLLEELGAQGRVAPGEFVVLGGRPSPLPCQVSSRLYPDWPFARLSHAPRDLAQRVAAALLTMPASDGKTWTAPLDYTPVHELFRELHIGPYPYTPPSFAALARAYWHWLAAAGAAILWWVVHVARVEVLVRRRAAELEREVAERERAEAAALRLREERDQLSRLGIVGEMASNIAHELNQPLAAISNFAHGMTHIFVRRRDVQRSPVDVNAVVAETLSLFGDAAGRRAAAIQVEPGSALPAVRADRVELQQVLLNLLQNAVEAGAGAIIVRTSAAEGMVEVAVRDSGSGLDGETATRMFEPFYTTKPDGLGLGLSICRTIVERHGGCIGAEGEPGRGVTVRFALPAMEEDA
jgi:two-component system sensor histidine kinase TtrS